MLRLSGTGCHFSFAAIGLLGILSLFGASETPDQAMNRFVSAFTGKDAAGFKEIIHPDIIDGKEIGATDVQAFLERYRGRLQRLETSRVLKTVKSEDGSTERFRGALTFKGPPLSKDYPGPALLQMTLQWVLEDRRWWLERPLSIRYRVTSNASYPTPGQQEVAMRFQTALQVLEKLGLPGKEDMSLARRTGSGEAVGEYRQLEKLYKTERGAGGVHPDSRGVKVLLRGAGRSRSGLLRMYHGDFKSKAGEKRKPVPWDMFRDYAQGAINQGNKLEKRGKREAAEKIYRRVIALGRQFLDQPGGLHFVRWGIIFQKAGATELARVLSAEDSPEHNKVKTFLRLSSRRLDLLQTALECLDDMEDYRSLKAALVAADRAGDPNFRPWGINTLIILALKGAPANKATIRKARGMVIVDNQAMREIASKALEKPASGYSDTVRAFISYQKDWVRTHKVYGSAPSFR